MRKLILRDGLIKLFIWVKEDVLYFNENTTDYDDAVVIFNFSKNYVSNVDKEDKILIRYLGKNQLKTLVSFMNSTFIPNIMNETSWPDNVRK